MSIGAAQLAAVITAAESVFPAAVLTMYWGSIETHTQSAQVVRTDSTETDSAGELGGVVEGLRGTLRLILSRCDPWEPPKSRSMIELYKSGVSLGTFVILNHNDDPTGAIRTLFYGEASA